MNVEIKVPEVGESITEGVLVSWFKEEGEPVQMDDPLFELETDKITMTVPAEHSGRLSIEVSAGSKVSVGQVVGRLDTTAGAEPHTSAAAATPTEATPPQLTPFTDQGKGPASSVPADLPRTAAKLTSVTSVEQLSPAVRRMVEEHRLDPQAITGSGKAGRLTKEDVVSYLAQRKSTADSPPHVSPVTPQADPVAERSGPAAAALTEQGPRQTRRTMSTLRQRIAERMVLAQQTAAILTTFNEVDMSAVLSLRSRYRDLFTDRYQVGLGLMSFFVKAAVDALKLVPMINAQIQGDEIVENHYYDIGVAVGTEHGLVVPVIRDADQLSFAQIEETISGLARRARERTLKLHELTGGTFTISNGGVYGSLLSTPILNPPQSGILGLHGIKKRPVVDEESIVIRPMMYLALSYDHRLVDGQAAVTFLKRVVACIENPERMMLAI